MREYVPEHTPAQVYLKYVCLPHEDRAHIEP